MAAVGAHPSSCSSIVWICFAIPVRLNFWRIALLSLHSMTEWHYSRGVAVGTWRSDEWFPQAWAHRARVFHHSLMYAILSAGAVWVTCATEASHPGNRTAALRCLWDCSQFYTLKSCFNLYFETKVAKQVQNLTLITKQTRKCQLWRFAVLQQNHQLEWCRRFHQPPHRLFNPIAVARTLPFLKPARRAQGRPQPFTARTMRLYRDRST